MEVNPMKDKSCLVTGATSGIGKATAMGIARMGATVVIVGRDRERGEAARDEIRNLSGNPKVDLLLADLS
jgi:short-subunit dehydrogenase